ncbi:hypothetical protein CKAH01_06580 [Colletotrichum kahawae]|uniref:Uncharacterized protein n=1 Tax=Colletotrichum kahawae TaxID=34407 RepID=A0AAE0D3M3_COLKA|nr:hypothetical protein CKAH01_06580 [Colletotrichum kahawae]
MCEVRQVPPGQQRPPQAGTPLASRCSLLAEPRPVLPGSTTTTTKGSRNSGTARTSFLPWPSWPVHHPQISKLVIPAPAPQKASSSTLYPRRETLNPFANPHVKLPPTLPPSFFPPAPAQRRLSAYLDPNKPTCRPGKVRRGAIFPPDCLARAESLSHVPPSPNGIPPLARSNVAPMRLPSPQGLSRMDHPARRPSMSPSVGSSTLARTPLAAPVSWSRFAKPPPAVLRIFAAIVLAIVLTPLCHILVKRPTPNIGTALHTQNGFHARMRHQPGPPA